MKKITVYSSPFCTYCLAAKRLLHDLQLPYEEVDLAFDDNLRDQLIETYHWQTVPIIVIGDECIGGHEELRALHTTNALNDKLA